MSNIVKYLSLSFVILFTTFYSFVLHKKSLQSQFFIAQKTKNITDALHLLEQLYDKRFYTMDGRTNRNVALKTHEGLIRFQEKKDIQRAIKNIKQALIDQPNYHMNYFHLGVMYKNIGELDQAQLCFEKVFELKHSYFKAQLELIKINISQNNKEEARKWYNILNNQISLILSKYAKVDEETRKLQNNAFYEKSLRYQKQLDGLFIKIRNLK